MTEQNQERREEIVATLREGGYILELSEFVSYVGHRDMTYASIFVEPEAGDSDPNPECIASIKEGEELVRIDYRSSTSIEGLIRRNRFYEFCREKKIPFVEEDNTVLYEH